MAKKAQHNTPAKKKKRKAQSVTPKERTKEQTLMLGSISIPVTFEIALSNATSGFNELVIEWGCLGLSEEPDSITEVTGSSAMLDKKKPITTSEEGLHMYFDPPLTASGVYGFKILCGYNEAVEPRMQAAESGEPDEQTKEQIEGERVTGGAS